MNSSVLSYTKLDLHSLGKKNVKIVSSEEALKRCNPNEMGRGYNTGENERNSNQKETVKEY